MKCLFFVIITIEILFFILGYIYLLKKRNLNNKLKYALTFLFYIVIILFNIAIIKTIEYNYFENKSNNIKLLQKEIKINKEIIKKLNNKELELQERINNQDYIEFKMESDKLINDISTITKEIETLNKDKDLLIKKLNTLEEEFINLEKKTKFIIKDFPTYNQFPNYPNGCESVALYLMLKYYKVDVTVEEIVEKLKKGDAPHIKNGTLYGGDPEIEFVGDPRLRSGYGVYEKPIIDVANQYKSNIKNIKGSSLNEVLKIVSKGIPVQVWASINLRNTYICAKWQSTSTNKIIEWKCGLHSLVIIGYTHNKIITSDPYTGNIEYYSKNQFKKIYNSYGKRAIYYES